MGKEVLFKVVFGSFVAVIIAGGLVALPRGNGTASVEKAEQAALYWVGSGTVQPARFENNEWEVDVVLSDGSLLQVTLNRDLELRDIDEELGPGGARAHDEVTGPLRDKATLVALGVTGPGRVSSVEQDEANEIEVNVQRPNGTQLEVELDAELNVVDVDREDPEDE
jgi:hypothetical protein